MDNSIIQLVSAAGIGGIFASLLTTIVQACFSNKSELNKRNFQEKKEAYMGLINSYRAACLQANEETRKEFAYWAIRCELVAPTEIVTLIEEMKTYHANSQEFAFNKLKSLIRKDLYGVI